MSDESIKSVSRESRTFEPPAEFAAQAEFGSLEAYKAEYARSVADPVAYWAEQAEGFLFYKKPDSTLRWDPPHAFWYEGGTTNLAANCLDRHVDAGLGDKIALIWEGEPGEVRRFTYRDLLAEVSRLSNVLAGLGVNTGDRVGIYMGMVPEATIAMLACARLGAIHTVIFGGFAADAIRDRLGDARAKVVITQDASYRRGQAVPLKEQVDRALPHCPTVENVLVLRRTNTEIGWVEGRDHDYHEAMRAAAPEREATPVDSEQPLFILYTSGTTGKPKGVLHTTAGYMVGVGVTTRYCFDLKSDDVYFCTADVGWVTGHSYTVYGPLLNAATVLMYEGAPNAPDEGRFWSLVERHRVSILYTAPTAVRAFVKWGESWPAKYDLSSLRLLGTVGEPINPEAWMWYRRVIGGDRCPIIDTWWQTETGAIMVSPLPGAVAAKPGSCCLPFFGIEPKILRTDGSEAAPNEGGLLVIDKPWPAMLRTVWGDDSRYRDTYFSRFPGRYFTGDGARRDADGYLWVMGRVDDVVNVSGHRLGTAELESALVSHESVAEAAVVGRPDPDKGQALVAFVTLKQGVEPTAELRTALVDHVGAEIGKFARPDAIRFAAALPKTRSGKIMRRILKEVATGAGVQGDVTTLEDLNVVEELEKRDDQSVD